MFMASKNIFMAFAILMKTDNINYKQSFILDVKSPLFKWNKLFALIHAFKIDLINHTHTKSIIAAVYMRWEIIILIDSIDKDVSIS